MLLLELCASVALLLDDFAGLVVDEFFIRKLVSALRKFLFYLAELLAEAIDFFVNVDEALRPMRSPRSN